MGVDRYERELFYDFTNSEMIYEIDCQGQYGGGHEYSLERVKERWQDRDDFDFLRDRYEEYMKYTIKQIKSDSEEILKLKKEMIVLKDRLVQLKDARACVKEYPLVLELIESEICNCQKKIDLDYNYTMIVEIPVDVGIAIESIPR